MLDTFYVGPRSLHADVTVREQRAPTDDSVRLLKEMEKAAQDKVDHAIRLEGNGFNALTTISHNIGWRADEVRVVFDLNGRRCVVEHQVTESDRMRKTKIDLAADLMHKVADTIAREILSSQIESMSPLFERWSNHAR